MKIKNQIGNIIEYKSVPDLWHLAMELKEHGKEDLGNDVLTAWWMAHTLMQISDGVSHIVSDEEVEFGLSFCDSIALKQRKETNET